VIRWASDFDLEKLLDLEARALPDDLRSNRQGLSWEIGSGCVAIATQDEQGDGCAVAMGIARRRQRGGNDAWHIALVAVDPDHRHQGLGTRILMALVRQAPPGCARITAVAVNEAGAKLLSSAGFTGDGAAFYLLQTQKAA
jgi:GNAT superfamily N-acetyltransferase